MLFEPLLYSVAASRYTCTFSGLKSSDQMTGGVIMAGLMNAYDMEINVDWYYTN